MFLEHAINGHNTLTLIIPREREIQTRPLGLYEGCDIMGFLNLFLANIAIQISVYISSESLFLSVLSVRVL